MGSPIRDLDSLSCTRATNVIMTFGSAFLIWNSLILCFDIVVKILPQLPPVLTEFQPFQSPRSLVGRSEISSKNNQNRVSSVPQKLDRKKDRKVRKLYLIEQYSWVQHIESVSKGTSVNWNVVWVITQFYLIHERFLTWSRFINYFCKGKRKTVRLSYIAESCFLSSSFPSNPEPEFFILNGSVLWDWAFFWAPSCSSWTLSYVTILPGHRSL